jgi:hypothetical protein
VLDFCRLALSDNDDGDRYYMAAHELAENVAKYSTGTRVSLDLVMTEQDGVYAMKIHARNETSPEKLRDVAERLSELKRAPDALEFYDRLILETAGAEGISGLGLARIRAEGELEIDYSINGSELTIMAKGPPRRPTAST